MIKFVSGCVDALMANHDPLVNPLIQWIFPKHGVSDTLCMAHGKTSRIAAG